MQGVRFKVLLPGSRLRNKLLTSLNNMTHEYNTGSGCSYLIFQTESGGDDGESEYKMTISKNEVKYLIIENKLFHFGVRIFSLLGGVRR